MYVADWPITIVGDFNCPDIDWNIFESPADNIQDILVDFICDNSFDQLVLQPTRGNNILDLVFTNCQLLINNVELRPAFSYSDHNAINFTVDFSSDRANDNPTAGETKSYLWDKADYNALNEYLQQIDWHNFMTVNLTPDQIWSSFRQILTEAFDLFVPFRITRQSAKRRRTVKHYPSAIRLLINRKLAVWRLLRNQPANTQLKSRYRQLQMEYRRSIYRYELEQEKRVLSSDDAGQFYKYVNKKLARSTGVGALMTGSTDANGRPILATDNRTKAELLNDYFASVYTTDDDNIPTFDRKVPDSARLENITFMPHAVMNVI